MKIFFSFRLIVAGIFIALFFIGLSFVLALFGFKNIYYASVIMPFFMLCCFALAWFLFLRLDGFGLSKKTHDDYLYNSSPQNSTKNADNTSRFALIWAGLIIGITATAMYFFMGIGRYFYM